MLGGMVSACTPTSGRYLGIDPMVHEHGDPYVVIPILDPALSHPTFFAC